MSQIRTFTAVLIKEEDMYIARCPELGTVSQGDTIDSALANLKEATELYLEELSEDSLQDLLPAASSQPLITTFQASYA
jgi:predicted RNase H-like HicB family nuclease